MSERARERILGIGGLIALLAIYVGIYVAMPEASVSAAAAGPTWSCDAKPWVVGARIAQWGGDTGAAGESFPTGTIAAVSSDTVARVFHVWLYSERGGDLIFDIPFGAVQAEPGTLFPTNRLDPQGLPVAIFDRGMVKVLVRGWNGGQGPPGPLLRLYTWCYWR